MFSLLSSLILNCLSISFYLSISPLEDAKPAIKYFMTTLTVPMIGTARIIPRPPNMAPKKKIEKIMTTGCSPTLPDMSAGASRLPHTTWTTAIQIRI